MKDYVFNKKNIFSILTVSILFFLPIFWGLNIFIKATSDEIINSWYESEKGNIQQGNLLTSVTKLQNTIPKSVLLKAVKVVDNKGRELISFYKNNEKTNWPHLQISTSDSSLQNDQVSFYKTIYRFSNNNVNVYILTASPISIYFLITSSAYFIFIFSMFFFLTRKDIISSEKFKNEVELEKITLRLENSEKINNIASQVSHDIRSPLAALNMVIAQLENIPDNYRMIIRSSAQRINDIANNLLTFNVVNEKLDNNLQVELLAPIIDSIVSEKRMQFCNKQNIIISFDIHQNSGLFAEINIIEFKRVISNLINNSFEELNDHGEIKISLSLINNKIRITISDNGRGIPADILEKLGQKGTTFGKERSNAGSGLGIFHAKKTIEFLGGQLDIKSELGSGTFISIFLPMKEAPNWFVEKIFVEKNMKIIILDDDQSIHHIWFEKFKNINKDLNLQVYAFSNAIEFESFLIKQSDRNLICLLDYELIGQKTTGLDLIEKLKISGQSKLVTSRYDEIQLRAKAQSLSLQLIPKSIASQISIEHKEKVSNIFYEYVYIEDDLLLRITWETIAKKNNINLLTLKSTSEFELHKLKINKDKTHIYIDSNLGVNELAGEKFAVHLNEKGYKNIYMASGFNNEYFSNFPWLKSSGKECPFKNIS